MSASDLSGKCLYGTAYRKAAPHLLDELSQYFKVYNRRFWLKMIEAGGYSDEETAQRTINQYLTGINQYSRHFAAVNTIRLFNRFRPHIQITIYCRIVKLI